MHLIAIMSPCGNTPHEVAFLQFAQFPLILICIFHSLDGRRPIYLTAIPTLALGSLGVTLARDLPTLFICRFIQAFGAGVGLSVGGGVIGDIYKLEERGTAMGIFFAVRPLFPVPLS